MPPKTRGQTRQAASSTPVVRAGPTTRSTRAKPSSNSAITAPVIKTSNEPEAEAEEKSRPPPASGNELKPDLRKPRSAGHETLNAADRPDTKSRKRGRPSAAAKAASAKGEKIQSLAPGQVAVVNRDRGRERARVIEQAPSELGESEDTSRSRLQKPAHLRTRHDPREVQQHEIPSSPPVRPSSVLLDVANPAFSPLEAPARMFDTALMVDHIPELWNVSLKITELLAPYGLERRQLKELQRNFQQESSRQRRNLDKYGADFDRRIKTFSQSRHRHIDPGLVEDAIFKQTGIGSVRNAGRNMRVIDVFHLANTATFARMIFSILSGDDAENRTNLDYLDKEFPKPYLSGFGDDIGESDLRTPTVVAGLRLRAMLLKSVFRTQSDQEDLAAMEVLEETFYENWQDESGETRQGLKGWNVESLISGSLGEQDEEIAQKILEPLQELIPKDQLGDSARSEMIKDIEGRYSDQTLVLTLLKWVSHRANELIEGFGERHPSGAESLQEALDALPPAPSPPSPPNPPSRRAAAKPPLGLHFLKSNVDVAFAELENQRRGSSGPSSTRQFATPSRTHIERVKSKSASKGLSLMHRSSRTFVEPQEHAQRVGLISDGHDSADDDDNFIPPNGQGDDDPISDDETARDEAERGDEESEHEFQNDERSDHSRRPAKRAKASSSGAYAPTARSSNPNDDFEIDAEEDEPDAEDRATGTRRPIKRTDKHKTTRKARSTATSAAVPIPQTKKPRVRKFWTQDEDEALRAGLKEFQGLYNVYVMTYDKYFKDKFDVERNNVDLKDRARNLKLQYLNAGRVLPPELAIVDLKSTDKEKLLMKGIVAPDRSYPTVTA